MAFDSAGAAQLATGSYASAYLIDMHFAGGPLYICTLPLREVLANGQAYTGVGHMLRVDPISTSEDGRADKVKLSLGITNDAVLALVLGDAANYRGRRIKIWLQLFTDTFVPVGAPQLEWQGFMEPVRVPRSRNEQGIVGRIEMPCTRPGLARSRNALGLRVNHAQQQLRYPGDKGLEYLQPLMENPVTWLSKRFQEIQE